MEIKLSEKILTLRKKAGLSQEELAEKLNVSRQAVSRWEVGSAVPDAMNVAQLARLFGVSADYLLNDDYESDRDVPAVRTAERAAKDKAKKIAALCVSAFGALGNFIIYILSRFVEVMVPFYYYDEAGKRWAEWSSDHTGHSFKLFIETYDLELLSDLFWVLLLAGLLYLILNAGRVKSAAAGFREKRKRKKRQKVLESGERQSSQDTKE